MLLLCIIINLTVAITSLGFQFDSWNNNVLDNTHSGNGYQLGHATGHGSVNGYGAAGSTDRYVDEQELGDAEYEKHYNTLLLTYGRTVPGLEDFKKREKRVKGRPGRGGRREGVIRKKSGGYGGRNSKESGEKGWLESRLRNERDQFKGKERGNQFRRRATGYQFGGRETGNQLGGRERGFQFGGRENRLVGFGAFNKKNSYFKRDY